MYFHDNVKISYLIDHLRLWHSRVWNAWLPPEKTYLGSLSSPLWHSKVRYRSQNMSFPNVGAMIWVIFLFSSTSWLQRNQVLLSQYVSASLPVYRGGSTGGLLFSCLQFSVCHSLGVLPHGCGVCALSLSMTCEIRRRHRPVVYSKCFSFVIPSWTSMGSLAFSQWSEEVCMALGHMTTWLISGRIEREAFLSIFHSPCCLELSIKLKVHYASLGREQMTWSCQHPWSQRKILFSDDFLLFKFLSFMLDKSKIKSLLLVSHFSV